MTVVTNGLACGFDWQCAANDIGYAVSWLQDARTPYRLPTSMVWVRPGRETVRAGQSGKRKIIGPVLSSRNFSTIVIYIYI